MRSRVVSSSLFFFVLFCASFAWANPKLDPYLHDLSDASEFKALSISVAPPGSDEPGLLDIFIKAHDVDTVKQEIRALGGSVRVSSGEIVTALVPQSALEELTRSDSVLFIEAAKPVQAKSDVAAQEINAPEVNRGEGLPGPYKGKGVIIGIIDTGIDYSHPDFTDADGNSRILSAWDQGSKQGTPPSEIEDSYGAECDAQSIASGSCSFKDFDGHGTHVAGIAAGADSKFTGVAPEANIVAVRYDARLDLNSGYADTIFSTKICEAAYYVFEKARKYGMPAVVNMSLGTHLGAHDGSSLFEQCLGGLVEGVAGRAIVAAAGNEYSGDGTYVGIHAGFDPEGKTKATNFVIRSRTSDRVYYIDFWGAEGSRLEVGLAVHKGAPSRTPLQRSYMARPGDKVSGNFLNGDVSYMINATETASQLNGKPHVGIRIVLSNKFETPSDYSFDLIVGGEGSFDAWLFPDKPARIVEFTSTHGDLGGDYLYVAGDSAKSVAIPATAPNVMAVAGYATRTKWSAASLNWSFNGQELGSILNFSSSGPTAAPEVTGHKPQIAAPGGMIASSLSSYASVPGQVIMDGGKHYLQAGTSMAAPFVSGAIALMFEHNPNFTQSDVEGFLTLGAYADSFVGSVPNHRWGHGKLDVLRSMELAIDAVASGVFDAQGSLSPMTGQGDGGPSCRLSRDYGAAGRDSAAALVLALALLMAARVRLGPFVSRK